MVRISLCNSRFSLRTYHSYLKTTGIHEYIIRAIKEPELKRSYRSQGDQIRGSHDHSGTRNGRYDIRT